MSKINYDKKLRSNIAEAKPRDSHGHFIPESEQPSNPSSPSTSLNSSFSSSLKQLLTPNVSRTNDEDTLIDVHVNNPLKKIVDLLQDIKRQKAFSFTVKGSLGIMGVALALSVFGIFGGSKMLCDKGIQTQVGILKELDSVAIEKSTVPLLGSVFDYYNNIFTNQNTVPNKKRTILLKDDRSTIHLPNTRGVSYYLYINQQAYITGQYDACSQTLKPQNQSDLQLFQ